MRAWYSVPFIDSVCLIALCSHQFDGAVHQNVVLQNPGHFTRTETQLACVADQHGVKGRRQPRCPVLFDYTQCEYPYTFDQTLIIQDFEDAEGEKISTCRFEGEIDVRK